MTEIFNQEWSKERRRELRNKPTKAERLLWFRLQRQQIMGVMFRRQYNIGGYIADFYVPSLRLVVEVDGLYHSTPEARVYDDIRTAYFSSLGLEVIRFTNDEVYSSIDEVIKRLQAALTLRASTPPLMKRGNKGESSLSGGAAHPISNDTSSRA